MARAYAKPDNICLLARLRAVKSNSKLKDRIYVSLQLHISVDMLVAYEIGRYNPPEEVIFKMAELYNDMDFVLEAFEKYYPIYDKFFKEYFGIAVDRQTKQTGIELK